MHSHRKFCRGASWEVVQERAWSAMVNRSLAGGFTKIMGDRNSRGYHFRSSPVQTTESAQMPNRLEDMFGPTFGVMFRAMFGVMFRAMFRVMFGVMLCGEIYFEVGGR